MDKPETPQEPNESEHPRLHQLDARSLRGLAHPLRMRLLSALRRGGPATASQLAEKLGESSGATSYHLRQLAAHGFVEDAPERGKGRERWWKAAHEGVSFDETLLRDGDPEVRGAADLFLHEVANTHTREVATWLGTSAEWPEAWRRAADMSDLTLRLTPDQAAELVQRMHALVDSYRDRAPADGTPDAEQVRVHTHLFPTRTA
ncbi:MULTISPECIES: ArsR/SmtB family transcription factor [Streptomyces]|uniref:Helix-turn-helix domain-containing protein n=2 Tax=Streptomyces TaxID=1883 RepID=A0ABU3J1D7_9ACTN|nr:DNA-binding transcriptional ArsR family regulator [Streptomyces thermodiastaticus]MDT6968879.1 helix-turn-helix domain-containing protein [Streptomyces thermocarboxydus]UVT09673.1 helix-turn-helix transcriptional regulator [Streptomyces thermocarboxydus]WSB41348.1 helix-turn-helix domain-containing protein [Streptomyces cellulosae]WTF20351.1 helix-turn-helix domain-containing protein [Streptomyces cellulosae]